MEALQPKYYSLEKSSEKKIFVRNLPLEKNGIDYYPYGMIMPGRSYTSQSYRYGFNGMERDDEIAGSGNNYTAPFWQYDSRLGRRWNVDPIDKSWESSYATFSNNPIYYIDPSGANAGEYTVDTETGVRTKVSTKGDEEGLDFIYYGHTAENGGFVADRTEIVDRQAWYDNTLITRDKWGAAPTNGTDFTTVENPRDFYSHIVVHHSGNDNSPSVNKVQGDHINDRGFHDIGYHYAIDLQGNIYEGRSINKRGAGAGPADLEAGLIHVVILGDMQNEGFWEWSNDVLTADAVRSLTKLSQYLVMKYNVQYTGGHQNVRCNHTDCPGNQVMDQLPIVRKHSCTNPADCLHTD